MWLVIILIIAIALLRILIPLLYVFLSAVWLVLWCIAKTIKNEIEKRRERKEWQAAQAGLSKSRGRKENNHAQLES